MTDADGNELGKVFIGGLSQATNDDSLRSYFTHYGFIEDCVVMMDNKTGRSRGFGYIKFQEETAVHQVLESGPHLLDGKIIDVKQCNVHMKGRNRRSLKIFVGGIGLDDNDDTLRQFFSQYGNVTDVNLMLDQSKQRHRGFAFVGFDDESVVKDLIVKHFITVNGKCVEIKAMEPPNFARKLVVSNDNDNLGVNSNHMSQSACIPNMFVCNSLPSSELLPSNVSQNPNELNKANLNNEKVLQMSQPQYSIQPFMWNNNAPAVWSNPYQFDKIINPNCVYHPQQQTNSCPHYHQYIQNSNQSMWTMLPSQNTTPHWNNYNQMPINAPQLINYTPANCQYPYLLQFPPQVRPVSINSNDKPTHTEPNGSTTTNCNIKSDEMSPTNNETPSINVDGRQDENWIFNAAGNNSIRELNKMSHPQIGEHIIKSNGDENIRQQLPFQTPFADFSFFQSTY